MSGNNVSIQDGELVFGGTVAATGGVAHAPLALGKMRRGAGHQQQQGITHSAMSSSSSSLPARATLRVAPPRPSSATGNNNSSFVSSSSATNRTPTPLGFAATGGGGGDRQDQIDSLLARSRAAAPTPGLNSSSTTGGGGGGGSRPGSRAAGRAGSPHTSMMMMTNKTSSSGLGPLSPIGSTRRLGERGVLQAEDFDVATDEAVPLNSSGVAAAAAATAGGGASPHAGGGGGGASAAAAANDPQSRVSTAAQRPLHVPYAPTVRTRTGVVDVMPALCLKDYILLAEACQRAGRARVEGTAYFKIAHLLSGDEEQKPRAASYLRKYLQICRRINDLQGEAKALNALGIIHYELALAAAAPGSEQSQMLLRVALGFHRQHAEIADAAGIFIANTNAGLCHSQLGDHAAAAEAHKLAASFAVQAGDRDAEALALSNLAAAATSTGDLATSRLCAQRQLDVGNATQNSGVSCEAHEQLAQLAIQRSDFATATSHLVSALEVALKEGDQRRALRLRCQLGVAQAAAGIENKMQESATNMEQQ